MRAIFHWLIMIGGGLFIILGILGLFLPILPGILLIILGLILLGGKSKIHEWITKKFPDPVRKYFELAESNLNTLTIILLIIVSILFGLLLYYFLQLKYGPAGFF